MNIFLNVIVPLIIITALLFVFIYINLKNNTFSAMKGEKDGKPNLLVRG
jgi:uncharacterized integral membrane protein